MESAPTLEYSSVLGYLNLFIGCILRVGTRYLTKSAAYTPKFAKTVLNLHLKHMDAAFGDVRFL